MDSKNINCWIVSTEIVNINTLKENDIDFTIIKKSILKTGYRGYCIDKRENIENKDWYSDFLIGNEIRVYIDGSGIYRIANIDLSDNEIYFEKLSIPIGYKPWVFFSWQSDYNPSRTIINDVLQEIIDDINDNHSPRQPLEIVLAARDEDGSANILESIKKNIDLSLLVLSDITNVSQVFKKGANEEDVVEKSIPNPNAVFELSYSFLKKKKDQVIILKRKRDELTIDSIPFDFSHNRHLDFTSKGSLKSKLDSTIKNYLRRINFIAQL